MVIIIIMVSCDTVNVFDCVPSLAAWTINKHGSGRNDVVLNKRSRRSTGYRLKQS